MVRVKLDEIFIAGMLMLVAIFGSCVRWVNTPFQRRSIPFTAKLTTAAFSGLMIYCAFRGGVLGADINSFLVCIISGISGFLGVEGLHWVISIVFRSDVLKDHQPQLNRRKADRKHSKKGGEE